MDVALEINIVFIQNNMTTELLRIITEDTGVIFIRDNFAKLIKQAVTNKLEEHVKKLDSYNPWIVLV